MQLDPSILSCVCGLFVVVVYCITYVASYRNAMPYAPCPLTPPSPLWGEGKGEGKGEVEVGTNDPEGPFGAKESGEGTQLAPAPAIINAIYDAIGVRFSSLPVAPQKVLEALHGKKN